MEHYKKKKWTAIMYMSWFFFGKQRQSVYDDAFDVGIDHFDHTNTSLSSLACLGRGIVAQMGAGSKPYQ